MSLFLFRSYYVRSSDDIRMLHFAYFAYSAFLLRRKTFSTFTSLFYFIEASEQIILAIINGFCDLAFRTYKTDNIFGNSVISRFWKTNIDVEMLCVSVIGRFPLYPGWKCMQIFERSSGFSNPFVISKFPLYPD